MCDTQTGNFGQNFKNLPKIQFWTYWKINGTVHNFVIKCICNRSLKSLGQIVFEISSAQKILVKISKIRQKFNFGQFGNLMPPLVYNASAKFF